MCGFCVCVFDGLEFRRNETVLFCFVFSSLQRPSFALLEPRTIPMLSTSKENHQHSWRAPLFLAIILLAAGVGRWDVHGLIQVSQEEQDRNGDPERADGVENPAYSAPSPVAEGDVAELGDGGLTDEENSLLHWAIMNSDPGMEQ